MKHYNLMPEQGNWVGNQKIISKCGSLFPFITTKSAAIKYAKNVKKEFPEITFGLYEGSTFGSMVLVQTF